MTGSTVETVHDLTDGERALARPAVLERPPVDWERHKGDKRPKILPPPGETWRNPGTNRKVGHRYYTRVTTYADAITESYNLTAWKLAKLLIGLGQRQDYVRQAAALTMDERDRDARDELVGKVLDAAGPDAAGLGTALHALTERLDRGEDIGTPPEEMLPDLAAYTAITEGTLTMLLREPRTVCDELECAGTPDTIAVVHEAPPAGEGLPACDCPPGRARVVDTKTGSIRYPGKMSTQLSIYAHSSVYDPGTGERTPLDVCPHWGVIVHLPVETGEAALFWLDLEHGWRGALLCGPVRAWHRAKADDVLMPFATVRPVKVVGGEVTRIEPRLASVNLTAPAPLEPIADITDALARSIELVRAGETVDADERAEVAEVVTHPSGHVEVVGEPVPTGRAPEREPIPLPPGPDLCAHSGGRTMRGNALVCRDCGEPAGFAPTRPATPAVVGIPADEIAAQAVRDEVYAMSATPALSAEAMSAAMNATAELGQALVDTATELGPLLSLPEQLAAVARGDDPDAGEWPGVDDVPVEDLASGPGGGVDDDDDPIAERSDLDPAPDPDPLATEIRRCVTVRDLELLGTTRWREWDQAHRNLAAEVHERLDHAERVEKPRAAAEAAILSAGTLDDLGAVMAEVGGAEWMSDDLLALADAQWRQLKRDAARVTS